MFSLQFRPISFYQWYPENRENVREQYVKIYGEPQDELGTCDECDGEGYKDCDMGHSHDCEECDGTGKMDKTAEQVIEEYAGDIYREQVEKDKQKVAKFLKEQEHVNE